MTDQNIAPQYVSSEVEPKIQSIWSSSKAFHADPDSKKPAYSIMMPPPNVTGVLHMGHALVNTLQDILIRWKKMLGYSVLWMPGTDHAGIATQTVVERHLIKSEGKRRTDYSRDEFLQKVWEWKERSETTILNQLKALGCACDWHRLRFTMDAGSNRAVRHMFKTLFDKGLIYRGDYLVNWDPITGTALADDEVEHEERNGFLYTIRYPIADSTDELLVATTRPETLLGDTAVAVHPKDDRYRRFIGKKISHPITGRLIPIVADEFVDPEFGTGVVKITPAHDPNDYQLAFRHSLSMINILDPQGRMNENTLHYQGKSVEEARHAIIEELRRENLLINIEPHIHRVGISYRSKATIEPMLSKQWFVRLSSFKKLLREQVEQKKVHLIPESWEATYFQWIDNLRDWCISRQLWWGHQIPVWHHTEDPRRVLCYDGEGVPPEVEKDPNSWQQDPDVLDTWFSSALWPFSTLGWPEKSSELAKFYPNATLITGHDILFFWVARMIMMGDVAMEQPPFHQVFLHGLIYGKSYWRTDSATGSISYVSEEERKAYDLGKKEVPKEVQSRWEKMSKSKGNVIDPIEVLAEYGTDAMRLALASCATDARQIDLDRRRFEEWKHFANKVWNGARFVLMNIAIEDFLLLKEKPLDNLSLEDRWILAKMQQTVCNVSTWLTKYAFDKASHEAYEFYWNEFCAYYVELIKPSLFGKNGQQARAQKQIVALLVLYDAIRTLHPFAPFITEEIFALIKGRFASWIPFAHEIQEPRFKALMVDLSKETLAETAFPSIEEKLSDVDSIEAFQYIQKVATEIRSIRGSMKIPPSQEIELFVRDTEEGESPLFKLLQRGLIPFQPLLRISSISFIQDRPFFAVESRSMVDGIELIIPLPEGLKESERLRVEKELCKLKELQEKTHMQLNNRQFIEKAPQKLVEKLQEALRLQEEEIRLLVTQKSRLG
ncbi:MAG: valine--tRNA ligase [Chlamydia sp.]